MSSVGKEGERDWKAVWWYLHIYHSYLIFGEENGNSLQDSCLGNPMDRGAWWATVHEVTKESDFVTKQQYHDKQQ